jgi:hypothetical protein
MTLYQVLLYLKIQTLCSIAVTKDVGGVTELRSPSDDDCQLPR